MEECIDHEARDRVAKLWTAFEQHSTDWWGPDKTNGKRSELVDVTKRLDTIEEAWKHFLDTRANTCLGLNAFNKDIEEHEAEEASMRIEQVKGKTLMTVQWIQVVGLVIVALITLWK